MEQPISFIAAFPAVKNAEFEFQRRAVIAATNLGYSVNILDRYGNVLDDQGGRTGRKYRSKTGGFVIATHFRFPKSFDAPHIYLNWNPLSFFKIFGHQKSIENITSFDFVCPFGSSKLDSSLRQFLGNSSRPKWLKTPFPPTSLAANQVASSNKKGLFYCGINWERFSQKAGRFDGLLNELGCLVDLSVYGPAELDGVSLWEGVRNYKGSLAFDGVSLIGAIRDHMACLVLLSSDHQNYDCASMRVFEALSAGTEIICPNTVYLVNLLGPNAHYYSIAPSTDMMIEEIVAAYKSIIAGNKKLSTTFIERFNRELSLEGRFVQLTEEWATLPPIEKVNKNLPARALNWISRLVK